MIRHDPIFAAFNGLRGTLRRDKQGISFAKFY